jgi:hypothetical protein
MGICSINLWRRSLVVSALAAGALLVAGLGGGSALAGDVAGNASDNLSVTGATAGVLPQTFSSSESGILQGLHVSGFISQTFGMWQNPTALKNFTTSRNNLATSRTWLQADENYQLDQNNSFFMREWFVYEPPYSFNSANGLGMYANEFYNQYTVRDAWWQNKWGPLTTYVGNQIVVWGQSLAFRVGDVVNPQDTTWAFGFANLEQSRTPQWMIHPILNLPEFAGTSSNFIEGIIIPRYQPMWNSCDYADHRYDGECNVNGGSVNNGFPAGVSFDPAGRFAAHFANRYQPPSTAVVGSVLPPYFTTNAFTKAVNPPVLQNSRLVGSPLANEFYYCLNAGSASQPNNPVPIGLQRNCKVYNGSIAPYTGPTWNIPADTVANWTEGARYHTLVGPAELTAFVYDPFNLYPNTFWQQYTNRFENKFVPEVLTGVTGDMPIPMPSSLSEYLPFVGRAEAVYGNHQGVNTWDLLGNPDGVRYTDSLNYMVALDVDQAYAPWLTQTGNLSANIEFQDFITLDGANSMMEAFGPYTGGALEPESNIKNNVSTLFNLGTSWLWNDVAPTWTMIFSPKGRSFLLFPSVVLNPPWTKQYFLKLQAVEILGGDLDYSQGGGILKGQSMLLAQFQYNFNLL